MKKLDLRTTRRLLEQEEARELLPESKEADSESKQLLQQMSQVEHLLGEASQRLPPIPEFHLPDDFSVPKASASGFLTHSASWLGLAAVLALGFLFLRQAPPPLEEPIYRQESAPITSIHAAAARGHLALVSSLSEETGIDARDDLGQTPLHLAAAGGHEDVVAFLIQQGADLNPVDQRGLTPLMEAAGHGYARLVTQLIAAGADPCLQDTQGRNAQALARYYGYGETAQSMADCDDQEK